MSKSRAVVIALIVFGIPQLIGTNFSAAEGGVVAQRQQAMRDMALAAKTIAAMFSGAGVYDRERFEPAAAVFADHAGARLSALFTGETSPKSAADESKIGAERQDFDKIAARLEELAVAFDQQAAKAGDSITPDMRMGSSAPGGGSLLGSRPLRSEADLNSIPAEHLFHMMLETCTTCHSKYRLRK